MFVTWQPRHFHFLSPMSEVDYWIKFNNHFFFGSNRMLKECSLNEKANLIMSKTNLLLLSQPFKNSQFT